MASWQALLIGLLQGATELFPVSSLGHAVVLPSLLHWPFDQSSPTFVPFLVLLHLGTATALVILYWREWVRIVAGFVRAVVRGRIETADERMAILLLVATIPGAAIGELFVQPLTHLFATPRVAAAMLIVNAVVLLGAELLRRRSERRHLSREEQEGDFKELGQIGMGAAALVGLFQAAAFVPGISRSGITMAGGLVAGLRHQDAAKFAFLMATPIIAGAGLLEMPQLVQQGLDGSRWLVYLGAAVLAGCAAYVSARFLVRYFRSGRLDPYAAYCAAFGAVSLLLLR